MQSFTAHGIPFDPKRDYQGVRYSYQAGYQATKALLDKGCRFTAIFATADVMAIGAIRALQDNGLQVPEEPQITGALGAALIGWYKQYGKLDTSFGAVGPDAGEQP